MTANERTARGLALLLPAALLAGAWGGQLFGGLIPCEMCHWQRWPHYAALVVALLALAAPWPRPGRFLVLAAAVLIAISGVIGVYQAGGEYHWWTLHTACTATAPIVGATAAERLASLMAAPVIRCDVPQWTLFGISLAGFNAILSLGGAAVIASLLRKPR
ncbi:MULTISPECIES: disulfide bond formation protein B [unclassified Sphingomonas]|uniref:disulfide bond formation protein B n=1 Tax=unclassified Sphingomonas TaxID=196159 RepID=UPI001F569210